MGRIKQTYLKRVATKLLREYPDQFTTDFQHNKIKVAELTSNLSGKSIRNKIAGCITRMVKQEKRSKAAVSSEQ